MSNRKRLVTAFGVAILGLVVAASGEAWNASGTNHLTFNRSVALPGVILPAGSYTFERADSQSTMDIVRVLSRDRSRLYLTAFTIRIQRPNGLDPKALVTFGETPVGSPPPIAAWYPAGEAMGHQFTYR
jgi:hypothetical protein